MYKKIMEDLNRRWFNNLTKEERMWWIIFIFVAMYIMIITFINRVIELVK